MPGVKISAKNDLFRRCGVAHPKEPTTYPDGHWTAAQLDILKNEPMLVVQEIKDELSGRTNAKDSIAAVKAAATLDDLNKLAKGEDRVSVLSAIDARRAELQAK